jgi:hypothetical protein
MFFAPKPGKKFHMKQKSVNFFEFSIFLIENCTVRLFVSLHQFFFQIKKQSPPL